MEDNMDNKQKLEQMIEVAKQVLKENPNDTWVQKGLEAMQKEVDRLNELEQKKWQRKDFTYIVCFYYPFGIG